ncbi:MAG: TraB/GumN family protein [Xanthomonadales bacterium]|jgi:pheromone shutdown-related protein TraB|nr:TraB/GumN family protein [Xanthomonadales bacterium]MDH3926233.1 TraB/GumN family protein [Xanthomonadales bacterium]MDH4000226.1 TraB/GumN family protein [Xanthomonadales bacterium]
MAEDILQDQPIRQIRRDGVEYTLLGTAHVSRASAEAVKEMASSGEFDAVAVELCQARYDALTAERKWTDLDLYRIIRDGKAGLVMANLALSAYQRRIAEQFGIEPGAEMRAATVAAKEQDIPLQLVDRDLATTLRRSYASVPWYKRMYMMAGLALGMVSSEEIDEEAIEKLKEGDILESTFTEFAEQSPELYEALIAERDRYMASRLREENIDAEGRKVLVVIGAGHMEGLAKHLESSVFDPSTERKTLEAMPPKSRWPKVLPWAIMLLIITGFIIGFSRSPELGWQLVFFWVVINGGLAALGALIARGHPLTVLSAVIAAPLTSLNPTIAAGMVTGLVESWLRKPRVSDLENLRFDITTMKGWFRNPATRILLVFFLSNLGSAIGTWVAGFKIFGALS